MRLLSPRTALHQYERDSRNLGKIWRSRREHDSFGTSTCSSTVVSPDAAVCCDADMDCTVDRGGVGLGDVVLVIGIGGRFNGDSTLQGDWCARPCVRFAQTHVMNPW